jgi:hypothetical protein
MSGRGGHDPVSAPAHEAVTAGGDARKPPPAPAAARVAAAGALLVAFLLPNRPRVQETEAQPASGIRPQPADGQAGVHHPGG